MATARSRSRTRSVSIADLARDAGQSPLVTDPSSLLRPRHPKRLVAFANGHEAAGSGRRYSPLRGVTLAGARSSESLDAGLPLRAADTGFAYARGPSMTSMSPAGLAASNGSARVGVALPAL